MQPNNLKNFKNAYIALNIIVWLVGKPYQTGPWEAIAYFLDFSCFMHVISSNLIVTYWFNLEPFLQL